MPGLAALRLGGVASVHALAGLRGHVLGHVGAELASEEAAAEQPHARGVTERREVGVESEGVGLVHEGTVFDVAYVRNIYYRVLMNETHHPARERIIALSNARTEVAVSRALAAETHEDDAEVWCEEMRTSMTMGPVPTFELPAGIGR